MRQVRQEICEVQKFAIVNGPNGQGIICTTIKEVIQHRISQAAFQLNDLGGELSEKIVLMLSGDHGNNTTKITIAVAQNPRPNSTKNHTIMALFPGQDSRENMEIYCAKIWEQIAQIKTIYLNGKDWQIVWYVFDYFDYFF